MCLLRSSWAQVAAVNRVLSSLSVATSCEVCCGERLLNSCEGQTLQFPDPHIKTHKQWRSIHTASTSSRKKMFSSESVAWRRVVLWIVLSQAPSQQLKLAWLFSNYLKRRNIGSSCLKRCGREIEPGIEPGAAFRQAVALSCELSYRSNIRTSFSQFTIHIILWPNSYHSPYIN